ncbi:MAG: hypothetical protein GY797_27125, partial [Deltaproteobacteria bacterium]|nr:hypothetical protein [Deltaproteobacteria bacterium]
SKVILLARNRVNFSVSWLDHLSEVDDMESLAYCFFGIICLFIVALVAFVGGGIGLISNTTKSEKNKSMWPSAIFTTVGGLILLIIGYMVYNIQHSFATRDVNNSFTHTEYVSMSDETMKPFLSAVDKVDRISLGFTPIPENARVEIHRTSGAPATYDVMLHIYADTSRTIALKKEGASYRWIGEQEVHTGPNQYETVDGIFDEKIVIAYQIVYLGMAGQDNAIDVIYFGNDTRLDKFDLTLEDVQPILAEWQIIQQSMPTVPSATN